MTGVPVVPPHQARRRPRRPSAPNRTQRPSVAQCWSDGVSPIMAAYDHSLRWKLLDQFGDPTTAQKVDSRRRLLQPGDQRNIAQSAPMCGRHEGRETGGWASIAQLPQRVPHARVVGSHEECSTRRSLLDGLATRTQYLTEPRTSHIDLGLGGDAEQTSDRGRHLVGILDGEVAIDKSSCPLQYFVDEHCHAGHSTLASMAVNPRGDVLGSGPGRPMCPGWDSNPHVAEATWEVEAPPEPTVGCRSAAPLREPLPVRREALHCVTAEPRPLTRQSILDPCCRSLGRRSHAGGPCSRCGDCRVRCRRFGCVAQSWP